jgi:hypothetical protein
MSMMLKNFNVKAFFSILILIFVSNQIFAQCKNCPDCEDDCRSKISHLINVKSRLERQVEEVKQRSNAPCPTCNCSKHIGQVVKKEKEIQILKQIIEKEKITAKALTDSSRVDSTTIVYLKGRIDTLIDVVKVLNDIIAYKNDTIEIKSDSLFSLELRTDTLIKTINESALKVMIEYDRGGLSKTNYLMIESGFENEMKKKPAIKAHWVKRILVIAEFYSDEPDERVKGKVRLKFMGEPSVEYPETITFNKLSSIGKTYASTSSIGKYAKFKGRYSGKGLQTPKPGKYECKVEFGGEVDEIYFELY